MTTDTSASATFFSGRRSFGSFNPAMERASKELATGKRGPETDEREAEKSVSDKHMTKRLEKYVGLRGKQAHAGSDDPSARNDPPPKKRQKHK